MGRDDLPCLHCASGLGCREHNAAYRRDLELAEEKSAMELNAQLDDRALRIRELVREWVSQKVHYAPEVEKLIGLASELIDAIDTAEIPKKGGK